MSNDRARTLRLPPPDLSNATIPRKKEGPRLWYRVHQSRFEAIHFSLRGIHRFSHPDCPDSLLYLACDTATCLFERFGDELYDRALALAFSLWQSHSITAIPVPPIHVCDLTNAKTLSALRVDLSALMHNDIKTPQQWGLAIQRHPANFQGIKFKSRFNGKMCLALFKRDNLEKSLKQRSGKSLLDSEEAADWLHKHKVSLY
jgi:RES domain